MVKGADSVSPKTHLAFCLEAAASLLWAQGGEPDTAGKMLTWGGTETGGEEAQEAVVGGAGSGKERATEKVPGLPREPLSPC